MSGLLGRGVVEGMREVEIRAEVVSGLEFWGEVLERSRCYESWVGVFEERERDAKTGEGKERREGKVINGGFGGDGDEKKRMSLEEALRETAPGPKVSLRDV